jgi:DNA invertase Pin-like site-specific DNA recombinase
MRVALYTRVSTDKQDTENQAVQLREFAARQGWQIVHEYVDYETGAESDRVEFKQMLKDASQRRFDLLLFWALDRLTREGVLPTLRYLESLTAYGIAWRSFTEQFFDSCGVFKDAIISIIATLAKQERVKRSERTKAGLALARARGKRLGQKPIDPSVSSEIRRLRSEKLSFRFIANQLNVSVATAHRACHSKSVVSASA